MAGSFFVTRFMRADAKPMRCFTLRTEISPTSRAESMVARQNASSYVLDTYPLATLPRQPNHDDSEKYQVPQSVSTTYIVVQVRILMLGPCSGRLPYRITYLTIRQRRSRPVCRRRLQ